VRRLLAVPALALVLGAGGALPAVGDDGTTIRGLVVDSIGAAVAGATVTAYSSRTDTTADATAVVATDGTFALGLPGGGTWYVRFAKPLYVTRWHGGATQATAVGVPLAGGSTVGGIGVTLQDLEPTGGLDFFPSKLPIKLSTETATIQSVRIDGLANVNGCACITFADGSQASSINGRTIYKVTFRKLIATQPVHLSATGADYSISLTDPAGSKGNVLVGGTSLSGDPLVTEAYGTLDSISITPLCLINWAALAGLGDLLNFGISATGYCLSLTAYAIKTYDPSPSPNPYTNPLYLPDATLSLVSQ